MPDIYIDQVKRPKLHKLKIFQNQGYKLETTHLLYPASFFKVSRRKQNRLLLFLSKALQLELGPV
jgi:hypothetical protein